jgi:hypothetical protein
MGLVDKAFRLLRDERFGSEHTGSRTDSRECLFAGPAEFTQTFSDAPAPLTPAGLRAAFVKLVSFAKNLWTRKIKEL